MGKLISRICDYIRGTGETQRDDYEFFRSEQVSLRHLSTASTIELRKKRDSDIASTVSFKIGLKDFDILKVLGKGSFGTVFLVRKRDVRKIFAMKVLHKDKLQKTKQITHTKTEREIMEKITHPFIVKLQYAFQNESNLYFVTEFMQGGELFFHLKAHGPFREDKALLYICEIILALEHLHKHGIIYRDLKPENILLDKSGHIKLTDFGLSKYSKNYNHPETKAFTICGTPEYLAPEILLGKGYDKTVDWWSLGVLIYEMQIGLSPFRKFGRMLDIKNYYQPLNIQSGIVSKEMENLILALLQVDPNERLGNGALDADAIKSQDVFKGIIWDDILNLRVAPSFKPELKAEDDLLYFDKYFTNMRVDANEINRGGKLKFLVREKSNPNEFENFSFVLQN
jgi:serine/threonine protein kinase